MAPLPPPPPPPTDTTALPPPPPAAAPDATALPPPTTGFVTPPPSPSPPRPVLASALTNTPSPRESPRFRSQQRLLAPQPVEEVHRPYFGDMHFARPHHEWTAGWRLKDVQAQPAIIVASKPSPVDGTVHSSSESDSDSDYIEDKCPLTTSASQAQQQQQPSTHHHHHHPSHHPHRQKDKIRARSWRMKERMRTVGVAAILSLNPGTPPPDAECVWPHARTECGVDPTQFLAHHHQLANPNDPPAAYSVLQLISQRLEDRFRVWHPKARIKVVADPTMEVIRKNVCSLRKQSRGERILVHVNGHGVPRPTINGELWAYNEHFTQYIPLSVFDLLRWAGSPAIFTFDCSGAGQLLRFLNEAEKESERRYRHHMEEYRRWKANEGRDHDHLAQQQQQQQQQQQPASSSTPIMERPQRKKIIALLACGPDESLPANPDLPADLFTSCLTTPITTALRWFIIRNQAVLTPLGIELGMESLVTGKVGDRRSMLGELHWVFTAVTDTIAWSMLPRKLFQRLFRQDLLVASMLRHFLLAERIFRSLGLHPQSLPGLPATWQHKMWDAWDLAVEQCLVQLPRLIAPNTFLQEGWKRAYEVSKEHHPPTLDFSTPAQFEHIETRFFRDQLEAFEVWLSLPPPQLTWTTPPPEQLPVVLQVLLSHQHRFVALEQLARFLELGPWAATQALCVGVFPYVLKLLQSPVPALKSFLVRIWARILALDVTCREELNNAGPSGELGCFVSFLTDSSSGTCADKEKALMVLALCCDGYQPCRMRCHTLDLAKICRSFLPLQSDGRGWCGRAMTHRSSSASGGEIPMPPNSTSPKLGDDGTTVHTTPLATPDDDEDNMEDTEDFSRVVYTAENCSRGVEEAKTIQWCCLALGKLWDGCDAARNRVMIDTSTLAKLDRLASGDADPQIREVAIYAMGCLLGPLFGQNQKKGGGGGTLPPSNPGHLPTPMSLSTLPPSASASTLPSTTSSVSVHAMVVEKTADTIEFELDLVVRILRCKSDGSPLVRRQVVHSVSRFLMDEATHTSNLRVAVQSLIEFRQRFNPLMGNQARQMGQDALRDRLDALLGVDRGQKYLTVWLGISRFLALDPFPAVSQAAQMAASYIRAGLAGGGNTMNTTPTPSFVNLAAVMQQAPQDPLPTSTDMVADDNVFERLLRRDSRSKFLEDEEKARHAARLQTLRRLNHEYNSLVDEFAMEGEAILAPFLAFTTHSSRNESSKTTVSSLSFTSPLVRGGGGGGSHHHDGGSSLPSDDHHHYGDGTFPSSSTFSSPSSTTKKFHIRKFEQLPPELYEGLLEPSPVTSVAGTAPPSPARHGGSRSPAPSGKGAAPAQPQQQQQQGRLGFFSSSSVVLSELQRSRPPAISRASSSGNVGGMVSNITSSSSAAGAKFEVAEIARLEAGKGSSPPTLLSLHPTEPVMVTVDNRDGISIWNFGEHGGETGEEAQPPLWRFSNKNTTGSSVNSLLWIDSFSLNPLLLTASNDGHIRIWRDVITQRDCKMISAFSTFPDNFRQIRSGSGDAMGGGVTDDKSSTSKPYDMGMVTPSIPHNTRRAPLVAIWNQYTSHVHASVLGKDHGSVRIWDLVAENVALDMKNPGGIITSMECIDDEFLLGVGYMDGSVRIFDKREGGRDPIISVAREHKDSVLGISVYADGEMVTGAMAGDVRVWDVRNITSRIASKDFDFSVNGREGKWYANEPVDSLSIHSSCKILAAASNRHSFVSLFAHDGTELCSVKPKNQGGFVGGLMGSGKSGKVACVGWHCREMVLGLATNDSVVSVFRAIGKGHHSKSSTSDGSKFRSSSSWVDLAGGG